MGKASCFAGLLGGKPKGSKVGRSKAAAYGKKAGGNDCPKVNPVEFMFMDAADTAGVGGDNSAASARDANAVVHAAAAEPARQERDASSDDDEKASVKRCSSDAGLAAGEGSSGYSSEETEKNASAEPEEATESSSVAFGRMTASLKLERSCSNIETARSTVLLEGFDGGLPLAKSRSYGDLMALPPSRGRHPAATTPSGAPDASPTASVRTTCSADRVMLKKRSSRLVLPSTSRKLWWRLLLWTHRSHRLPTAAMPPSADTDGALRRHDGYASDTLDAAVTTPAARAKNKEVAVEDESLDRVSAWVNSLENASFSFHAVDEEEEDDIITELDGGRPRCSEIVESSTARRSPVQARRRAADVAAVQASSVVQTTLNAVSSVAHISGMGLQAVPVIAAFYSLRAVNLSGNFIVQISPGSLPKGLHSLDLSRNKIASIEGLREMTKLRVLNLSYNRIARIGHGLSSCTAIRELYLAGNKVSGVEGLHRLLKLAVLDVSFNRVTTAKSLGQLAANYGSLRALNLAGNPVQANVGDDALRRAVSGLLPRLEYLNRQAVRPQRATEAAKDSVAQAALGNGGGSRGRRAAPRRVASLKSPGSLVGAAKSRGREGSGGGGHRRGGRSRSETRARSSGPSRS